MNNSKILNEKFNSCLLFPFTFMSIIWANIFDKRIDVNYEREIIYTKDEENLALDWRFSINKNHNNNDSICIILPGIFGTSKEKYIKPLVSEMNDYGFDVVVVPSRGLGVSIIKNDFFTEKIDTDIKDVVNHISNKHPEKNIYLIGISFGSSILCRYLNNCVVPKNIKGNISISNPFDVYKVTKNLIDHFYNLIYSINIAQGMKKVIFWNKERFEEIAKEKNITIDFQKIKRTFNLFDIDKEFMKKLYPKEYPNPKTYYYKLSSNECMKNIKVPSLIINADDDPISHKSFVPTNDIKNNEKILFVRTPKGGHAEFFTGINAVRWYTKISSEYLTLLNTYIKNESNSDN